MKKKSNSKRSLPKYFLIFFSLIVNVIFLWWNLKNEKKKHKEINNKFWQLRIFMEIELVTGFKSKKRDKKIRDIIWLVGIQNKQFK